MKNAVFGSLLGLGLVLGDSSFGMEKDHSQQNKNESPTKIVKEDFKEQLSEQKKNLRVSCRVFNGFNVCNRFYTACDYGLGGSSFFYSSTFFREGKNAIRKIEELEESKKITAGDIFELLCLCFFDVKRYVDQTDLSNPSEKLSKINDFKLSTKLSDAGVENVLRKISRPPRLVSFLICANCPKILDALLTYCPFGSIDLSDGYSNYGVTPVMAALRAGYPDVVKVLVKHGASLTDYSTGNMLINPIKTRSGTHLVSTLSNAIDGAGPTHERFSLQNYKK